MKWNGQKLYETIKNLPSWFVIGPRLSWKLSFIWFSDLFRLTQQHWSLRISSPFHGRSSCWNTTATMPARWICWFRVSSDGILRSSTMPCSSGRDPSAPTGRSALQKSRFWHVLLRFCQEQLYFCFFSVVWLRGLTSWNWLQKRCKRCRKYLCLGNLMWWKMID